MSCHSQIDHPKTFEVNNQTPTIGHPGHLCFSDPEVTGSSLLFFMACGYKTIELLTLFFLGCLVVAIWRQLVLEACPIPAEITASYPSNSFTYVFLKESLTFFKDKQVWSCQPSPFSGPLADPVASPRCFSPNSGPPANRIGKILHLWAYHKENLLNLAACMNAT